MNILFVTLMKIETLKSKGIYHDLMRQFAHHGHHLYIVSPVERRDKKHSSITTENGVTFLTVRSLNVQKTNVLEKGMATVTIGYLFLRAVKKYFSNIKFDLLLYSTPPITLTNVISYIRKRDKAVTYLLLKDIFPQNAVDMKMFSEKSLFFKYFRRKEKKLYGLSDYIGCMSAANRNYILSHNPTVNAEQVEVNPNSIEPEEYRVLTDRQVSAVKKQYSIPPDRRLLIYGGNLGKPQGLDFLLEIIRSYENDPRFYFLIVGSGTEYERISRWFEKHSPENAKLLAALPKQEYDSLVKAADLGMIFLHPDFTIPNFPSRLLSYLEAGIPVLVIANSSTDIGSEVVKHHCGSYVESGDFPALERTLNEFYSLSADRYHHLRTNARKFLDEKFHARYSYEKIIEKVKSHSSS